MSIENSSEIHKLIELFKASNTETDKSKRNQIEEELRQYEKNLPGLIHLTSIILLSDELKSDQSIKLGIVIFLKNLMSNKIKSELLKKEEILKVFQEVIGLAINPSNVDKKIQVQINEILSLILKSKDIQEKNLIQEIFIYLSNSIENTNINKILNIINIVFVILTSINPDSEVFSFNLQIVRQILNTFIKLANEYISRFTSFQNEGDIDIFVKLNETKKIFFDCIFIITLKLKNAHKYNQSLSEDLIHSYLDLTISSILYEFNGSSFVCFSNHASIDSCINVMKSKAFIWIALLVQFEGNEIKNSVLCEKSISLFFKVVEGFKLLIDSKMEYLSNMGKSEKDFPDNEYNTLIFQANLFISRIMIREPVISKMNKFIKEYVMSIIFPLLLTTKAEYIRLKADGEDHQNFFLDCTSEFINKSYKTSVAFVLTKLVEKHDGLLQYIITEIILLLEFIHNGGLSNGIGSYNLTFNLSLIQNNRVEIIVDLCIFILNVLSKQIIKSPSIKPLQIFFIKYFNELIILEAQNTSSPLTQSCISDIVIDKLTLFLGLYSQSIILSNNFPKENYNKILTYLFNSLINFNKNQGTSFLAAFSIKNIFSNKDLNGNFIQYMIQSFHILISVITEIEVIPYFSILETIVLSKQLKQDHLILLISKCNERVLKEIKSVKGKSKESDINVYQNKCLNIIIDISEEYISLNPTENTIDLVTFENLIVEIISYVKNPLKCEFCMEIIQIITNIQKLSNNVINSTLIIFQYLEKILKKYGMTRILYNYLYTFLNKYSFQNHEDAQKLISLIEDNILTEDFNHFIYNCLIMQFLLIKGEISIESANRIIEIAYTELSEIHEESIKNDIDDNESYKFVFLSTIICSGFIKYSDTCLFYLLTISNDSYNEPNKQNLKINNFLEYIESLSFMSHKPLSQIRILIVGLVSLLKNGSFLKDYSNYYKIIFEYVINLLDNQKKEEADKLKNDLKDQIDCGFIEDEIDDDDSEHSGHQRKNSEESESIPGGEELKLVLKDFNTPFSVVDEFAYFYDYIEEFRKSNYDILNQLSNSLQQSDTIVLNSLLKIRRHRVGNKELVRNIVKIKRKLKIN